MSSLLENRPHFHRIDPPHRTEAADDARAPHAAPPVDITPTVSDIDFEGRRYRVESWTDRQWAETPEAHRPSDVTRAASDNGWSRIVRTVEQPSPVQAVQPTQLEAGGSVLGPICITLLARSVRRWEEAREAMENIPDDTSPYSPKPWQRARQALQEDAQEMARTLANQIESLGPSGDDNRGGPAGFAHDGLLYLTIGRDDDCEWPENPVIVIPLDRIGSQGPPKPPQFYGPQPEPTDLRAVVNPDGRTTTIYRRWPEGATGPGGACKLCTKCTSFEDACMMTIPGAIPRDEARLYSPAAHGVNVRLSP